MTNPTGKRVLITGGAGGIAFEMARKFADEGCALVLADVEEGGLEQAAARLTTRGAKVVTARMDVTDEQSILGARETIRQDAGRIDVLVNNAGIVAGGAFLDVPLDEHRHTYDVNTFGLVAVTHAFLPDLLEGPEGHLVNVASASGFIGLPFGATYASSKWAVIGFSESIRAELSELGHRHVHVTTVCPGYVATGMFAGVRPPFLTPLLEPERVAEAVIRAVRRNDPFVLEPFLVRLTPTLKWLLPPSLFDHVSSLLGVQRSLAKWRGRSGRRGDSSRRST